MHVNTVRVRWWSLVAIVAASAVVVAAQSARENAADASRLIEVLGVREGSVVGEIGAGSGELTVAMGRAVGPSGHVYSNDLNPDRRAEIRTAAEGAGLANVTIVEGRSAETNLSEACCDAIFMRNVYHHFADPASMDRSLFRSLKPGGRLAVIDFVPKKDTDNPAERAGNDTHGVTPAHVQQELREAGFEIVSSGTLRGEAFLVVARRPGQGIKP
ncbi:MAG TPA: methyltransferase domain-containing protein [Gemmatimonadaceae bacterium]|nr:methyltransferase domain-containing protein [Vicinamibacterales bacterium]